MYIIKKQKRTKTKNTHTHIHKNPPPPPPPTGFLCLMAEFVNKRRRANKKKKQKVEGEEDRKINEAEKQVKKRKVTTKRKWKHILDDVESCSIICRNLFTPQSWNKFRQEEKINLETLLNKIFDAVILDKNNDVKHWVVAIVVLEILQKCKMFDTWEFTHAFTRTLMEYVPKQPFEFRELTSSERKFVNDSEKLVCQRICSVDYPGEVVKTSVGTFTKYKLIL